MKPGDLVEVISMSISKSNLQGKIGLIVSHEAKQADLHSHYRTWKVFIDGKIHKFQGMNLKFVNELDEISCKH